MPDHQYDLENEFSQNINDTPEKKDSSALSQSTSTHIDNNSKGSDDIFKPQMSIEEQQMLIKEQNSTEFQTGLQEILPQEQPSKQEPQQGNLQGMIQQWQQKKKNTTGIPDNIKQGIESLSGISLDDVTVHYDSLEPAKINAHAYTEGTDVYIGPGQEEYLPHELWHVIQQKQGRVKTTKKVNGQKVNDKPSLEQEAETGKVKQMQFSGSPSSDVIQRVKIDIPDWGTEDTANLSAMIEVLKTAIDEDITLNATNEEEILAEYKRKTYDSNDELLELVKKYFKIEDEDTTDYERELAFEDSQTWQQDIGETGKEQFRFLQSVVTETRNIIPIAINRLEERPDGPKSANDITNRKFKCQQKITKDFATVMNKNDILVNSNYIHPAALERIMIMINEVDSELSSSSESSIGGSSEMAGICKDFATISYGLIKQNDPKNVLKTQLSFIKDHIFVEVEIEGKPFVVDAWRTAGKRNGVIPKGEHVKNLNSNPKPKDKTYRDYDDSVQELSVIEDNPRKQESLDNQYKNFQQVYKLWRKNEARYRKLAVEMLSDKELRTYIVTGKF